MKSSLIDTDILSQFFKGYPQVVNKFDQYLEEYGFINLSIISYYEILNGLLYKDAKKQMQKFTQFVELNKVLPLSLKSARIAAEIQADLRKKRTEIGHTDTLIAGIALSHNLQIVTNNTRHFERIKGLEIENWLK